MTEYCSCQIRLSHFEVHTDASDYAIGFLYSGK